jgi:hypothetical protein
MNQGEIAELKFIATLCCYISNSMKFKSGQLVSINEVGIPCGSSIKVLSSLQNNVTPATIKSLNEVDLLKLCLKNGITKASNFSKADVYINRIGYSLKYTNASPSAIVNHTRRTGWEFVARKKGISILPLDILINDYWQKRQSNLIGEDISNSDPLSPFASNLNILLPYLEYFIFEGTGTRLSNHPASEVIQFSDPCNFSTWDLLNKNQLVQNLWTRLVFSMRSGKGMVDINTLPQKEAQSVMLWAKNFQGSLKGALHVRVR